MNYTSIALIGTKSPFRTRVSYLLWGAPFRVTVKTDDTYDAIRQLGSEAGVGLVVIECPPYGYGCGGVASLRRLLKGVPIVVLTQQPISSQIADLLVAGADSVLTADISRAGFHRSLSLALLGVKTVPASALGLASRSAFSGDPEP